MSALCGENVRRTMLRSAEFGVLDFVLPRDGQSAPSCCSWAAPQCCKWGHPGVDPGAGMIRQQVVNWQVDSSRPDDRDDLQGLGVVVVQQPVRLKQKLDLAGNWAR